MKSLHDAVEQAMRPMTCIKSKNPSATKTQLASVLQLYVDKGITLGGCELSPYGFLAVKGKLNEKAVEILVNYQGRPTDRLHNEPM
jgi:hypothetical protein